MDSPWLDLEFCSLGTPASPVGIIGDGTTMMLGSPQPPPAAAAASALFVEETPDKQHDFHESPNTFINDELLQAAQPADNTSPHVEQDSLSLFHEFFSTGNDQELAEMVEAASAVTTPDDSIPLPIESNWMETAIALNDSMAETTPAGAERTTIDDIVKEIRSEAQRIEVESGASSDGNDSAGESVYYTVLDDVPLDEQVDEDMSGTESPVPMLTMPPSPPSSGVSSSMRARRKRPLNKDEKRERKKAQNVTAARRYRQKKLAEAQDIHVTLDQLGKRNTQLKANIRTTQAEIEIMKRLLRDVRADLDL